MKSIHTGKTVAAIAIAVALAGCSSWQRTDKETGTATGAVGGAAAGAVVGGPVGAVVGGVGGAVVGHETTGYPKTATTTSGTVSTAYDASTVRAAQQALNARGYNVGPVDGQFGASTQDAVRRFQQASNIPATGELTPRTLSALGVS